MKIRYALAIAGIVVGGGLVLPALAQTRDGATKLPDQSMGGTQGGRSMGHGMMSGHGKMSGSMMSGGCAGMMQSMNGGDGRPNSQWQTHRHGDATQD